MTRTSAAEDRSPLVFLVAGEPSGDQLGARLMAALKAETGGRIRFAGVGGEGMAKEGLESLFPMDELAVMGIVEVLPHARRLHRRIGETVAAVRATRPDVLVTIDSPSFTLRVSRRLKGSGVPLVHYVAPSVWAWKPWRARRMAGYLDHLLALLPFEPPYFETHGLATTFVGHPAVERAERTRQEGAAWRAQRGIAPEAPVLCVLPGSRRGEVGRLAPVFGRTLGLLAGRFPGLRALVPTVGAVANMIEGAVRDWPVPAEVLSGDDAKYDAFAAADAALAASGTVAVELAVAGLPAVIAYRVHPLTAFLAAPLIRVDYASIVNLMLQREVQPERLQRRCTPDELALALERLLRNPSDRRVQREDCALVAEQLGLGGSAPSLRAARCVLSVIGSGDTERKIYNA
jgi:lipid-A-disaccharide synthase